MADTAATVPTAVISPFPVAAIICISIGAYIVVMVILLIVRQVLMKRGICGDTCGCCGKEGEVQCCECWISFAEACNCCKSPNIQSCLDSVCPARKNLDCADIIMCQCCANEENQCCGSNEPLCDDEFECGCNCCEDEDDDGILERLTYQCWYMAVSCQEWANECCPPQAEATPINCICFDCRLKRPSCPCTQ